MYFTIKPDSREYKSIVVDGKVFYCLEDEKKPNSTKRRYSDQFSNPHFKIIDKYRRLKFYTDFFYKNNLTEVTNKYKAAIAEAIDILKKEADIDPKLIYKHFCLDKYGFDKEDYGINFDEETFSQDE